MNLRTCLFFGVALACNAAGATIIADFKADYQAPTPKAGWTYMWNSAGVIGTEANYTALTYDGVAINGYDVTPGTFPAPGSASYTVLLQGFMHPGTGTSSGTERYTIARYTLPSSGTVSLVNLVETDGDTSNGDGVNIFVGVNNGGSIVSSPANGGSYSNPSISLGSLNAGDRIYVAIGAKVDNSNDSTNLQYQIDIVPEPSSLVLLGLGAVGLVIAKRRRSKG